MYCRWETGLHPRESLTDLMVAAKDHINSLDDHIRLLQKRVKLMEEKLTNPHPNEGNNVTDETLDDNRLNYKKNFLDEVR